MAWTWPFAREDAALLDSRLVASCTMETFRTIMLLLLLIAFVRFCCTGPSLYMFGPRSYRPAIFQAETITYYIPSRNYYLLYSKANLRRN
eukprot:5066414-Amphidinium_carterae.1